MKTLRMGTRGSALALAQSGQLARALLELVPGVEVETVAIATSGDRFAAQNPVEPAAPSEGAKGLFVKEIEEALQDGRIDFAVHSAKDLPAQLASGLLIAAYPEREDARDAFIAKDGCLFEELPARARVGTSSLRRKYQLLARRPDLEILPLRGNVDTRLRRLEAGQFEGIVLALAGLRRLGRGEAPHETLDETVVLPAPGQGALAVEARADRPEVLELLARIDHARTRLEVEFERAFLSALGGGCSTPLGARARASGAGVEMSVFWSRVDGTGAKWLSGTCADLQRREVFVAELAARASGH